MLFLNNAINHGILTPLGTEQVLSAGKSILFLLEANPGPGLGVLLAFMFLERCGKIFCAGSNNYSFPWWYPRNLLPICNDETVIILIGYCRWCDR